MGPAKAGQRILVIHEIATLARRSASARRHALRARNDDEFAAFGFRYARYACLPQAGAMQHASWNLVGFAKRFGETESLTAFKDEVDARR